MRRLLHLVGLAAALTLALFGGHGSPEASQVSFLSIRPVSTPAAPGSAQPRFTVSSRGVLLSWIERSGQTTSFRFAERIATGWSQVRTVAQGSNWFVNWADVPSVIRLDDGSLYGHWLQRSGSDTYAYDVRLARSTNDGRTWTETTTVRRTGDHTFNVRLPAASGPVSLKVIAFDEDGNRVSQEVIRAYNVR